MYMSSISFYLYYIYILTLLTKALSRKQKSLPSKSYFCWFKLQMDRIHSLSYFYLCPFRPRPPAPCSHRWFKHECCDASEPVPTGSGVSTHISDRSGPWARLHNGCGFKREDLWGNRALQKGRKAKCGHEGETLVFPFPLMEFKKKKKQLSFSKWPAWLLTATCLSWWETSPVLPLMWWFDLVHRSCRIWVFLRVQKLNLISAVKLKENQWKHLLQPRLHQKMCVSQCLFKKTFI